MYASPNPMSPDGFSRISRPTLTTDFTVGSGPIYQAWSQDGTFNGDALIVSGTTLYRCNLTTAPISLGSLPGTDIPKFAEAFGAVFITRNGVLYRTDGTAITTIVVPGSQPVNSIASINGYLLLSLSNSQVFYWITPGSVTIAALNFASAERIPDYIVDIEIISDEIWFIGKAGPEVWSTTGDAVAPFQRINGRVYEEGCHHKNTVSSISIQGIPALFWVTDTKAVVKAQGHPTKVSNESVEELLKTSDTLSAWSFRYNRHDFYLISSPLFTIVYDITTNLWSKWDTYLLPYWAAQTGFQIGSTIRAGDVASNKIYKLVEGVGDDALPVIREVAGFIGNAGPSVSCKEVVAYVNSGWSPSYTITPMLELRWSDDLGATWSDYIDGSLGQRGDYSRSVSYRGLGLIKDPGRIFEFRISDFVRFRLDYCMMNERFK